jgi:hypothetical protein
MMKQNYTVHPWHGISAGVNAPDSVTAFIEIVPTDTVKYEIDKASGFLKLIVRKNTAMYYLVYMDLFRKPIVVRKLVIIAEIKPVAPEFMVMAIHWIFVCLPKKILHMAIL